VERRAGLIFGAYALVVVAIAVAPTVIDFAKADTDEHGRVPVPGEAVLDLPEGELGVYYGERRKMPSTRVGDRNIPQDLPVPELDVRAVQVDGGGEADLRTSFVDGIQVGGTSRTTRQFGVLDVPEDGDYRVSVRNQERIRYPDPRLSLGTDSTDKIEWGPSEWVREHIVLVIVLGLGVVVAGIVVPLYMPSRAPE
jgi:hypothetical protein